MKKVIMLIIGMLLLTTLVIADESFYAEVNENFTLEVPMANNNLTSCNSCTCTISIFYPDGTSLVKNDAGSNVGGYCQYNFSSSTIGIHGAEVVFNDGTNYGRTTFEIEVNPTGDKNTMVILIADLIMILLIIFLIYIIHHFYGKIDLEKMDKKLVNSHDGDFSKTYIKGLGYGLMKNAFLWYYLAGWILLFFIRDLAYRFTSQELYGYLVLIMNIYSFGFLVIFAVLVGVIIRYFRNITEMINDMSLGTVK